MSGPMNKVQMTRYSQGKGDKSGSPKDRIDRPEKEPTDPILNYKEYMNKIRGTADFSKSRSRYSLLNEFALNNLCENRFDGATQKISSWNSKFRSQIGQPFSVNERNTDIPGTVTNKSLQWNGPDNDVFIDVNADACKPSLHLGMVDISRQVNHRD